MRIFFEGKRDRTTKTRGDHDFVGRRHEEDNYKAPKLLILKIKDELHALHVLKTIHM